MIKHIVIWKFKENEEEKMKEFLEGLNRLKGIIPEIKSMETGVNINPKNEYDAILISEFETMDSETGRCDPSVLRRYQRSFKPAGAVGGHVPDAG